jgi:hypothetical protein
MGGDRGEPFAIDRKGQSLDAAIFVSRQQQHINLFT